MNKAYFDWLASERVVTHADDFGAEEHLEPLQVLQVLLHSYGHSAGLTGVGTRWSARSCAGRWRRA